MSELEQQAAAWIPPWQREPEPSTDDDDRADDAGCELVVSDVDPAPVESSAAAPASDAVPAPESAANAKPAANPELAATPAAAAIPAAVTAPEPATPSEAATGSEALSAPEAEADSSDVDIAPVVAASAAVASAAPSAPVAPAQRAAAEEPVAEWDSPEQLAGLTDEELRPALEAILMVVDEPVSEIMLAQVLEVPADRVADTLLTLAAAYTQEGRGFDLRRAAGGWRFYTRSDYASYVEKFVLDGQQLRLTQASLETLAVIAYKQPVTRGRISAIRGVNCDGVIRTLVTRGMIEECGSDPDSGAHLYRTTTLFLEKMGLDSVEQLPNLAPFLPTDLEEIDGGA